MTDWQRIDAIEERAAIIQDGERCARQTAEHVAARHHGFASWADYRAWARGVTAKARQN